MAKTTRRGENPGRRTAGRRGATQEQVQTTETAASASADDRSFIAGRPTSSASPTREDIARRAYEIYKARGGTHGYDIADWLQAERELRSK